MMRLHNIVVVLWCLCPVAFGQNVPAENKEPGSGPPPLSTADAMAASLVSAIMQNDGEGAAKLFFPKETFIPLKDVKNPGEYYDGLVKEYRAHVDKLATSAKSWGPTGLVKLKPGNCKWKAVGTEYNKIAYWSCYRNEIMLKSGKTGAHSIKLRTMVNWGTAWYITHL